MLKKLTPKYKYSGVYMIRNERTGKVYIGSSCDIESRIAEHRRTLAKGKHICRDLQHDYDLHHPFTTHVLYVEAVPSNKRTANRRKIYAMEWKFIEQYDTINSGYNRLGMCENTKKAL